MSLEDGSIFREEALREYSESKSRARLLHVSPRWNGWAFWILVFTLAGGLVFSALVPLDVWVTAHGVVENDTVDGSANDTTDDTADSSVNDTANDAANSTAHVAAGTSRVRVVVPAPERPRIEIDQRLLIARADSPGTRTLQVGRISPFNESAAALKARLGFDLPDVQGQGFVVTSTAFEAGSWVPGTSVQAEILVGRETVLKALLPGSSSVPKDDGDDSP